MGSRYFLDPETLPADAPIGGKAQGLLRLQQAGLRVPPWRVMDATVAATGTWRADAADLMALFEQLAQPPFDGVAVRSSATMEDGRAASYAGVFETVLVDRADEMFAAIETVIASAQSDRATQYAGSAAAMAVVVQARITPTIAGVAFSADPSEAAEDEWYCEAVHGLAGGLVDGQAAPSRFWFPAGMGVARRYMPGANGPANLNEADARTLGAGLVAMEQTLDTAVDIEWAIDPAGLWFLQARPVTRLSVAPPDCCATSWFFDQRFTEPIYPFTRTTLLPLICRVAIDEALAMRGVGASPAFLFYGGQAYLPHAVYRAMLRGAPDWWLSADLRALRPAHCACPPEQSTLLDTLWYAADALATVMRDAGEVFRNVPRWEAFRDEIEARVPQIAEDARLDWREKWRQLDALSVRFLRLHRWSILWADYSFKLLSLLPGAIRENIQASILAKARLVTVAANRALARFDPANNKAEFIATYGHRSGSLDYAVPTWAELAEAEALPRATAEGDRIDEKQATTCVPRLLVRLLEMREEQRFTWERILAAQRAIALDRGRALADAGRIAAPDDLWFLTRDEVWVDGDTDLLERVERRKHARRLECLVERPFIIGPQPPPASTSAARLDGLGASRGYAEGRACLLTQPGDFDPEKHSGVILVLPALDPAWTYVLPQLRGLVIERGGMLSHASVLAREYGVPLVIGVPDATRRIVDGAEITIDGSAGTVQFRPEAP